MCSSAFPPPCSWAILLMFLVFSSRGLNWQENLRPKIFCSMTSRDFTAFIGNHSHQDHFSKLFYDPDTDVVLIGARNILYKLSASELRLSQTLQWHSTDFDRENCIVKGKDREKCQNYISVLSRYREDPSRFMVCGTNAFKPMCREYVDERGSYVMRGEMSGLGLAPFDPGHNSTAVLVGEELYAGTVADFTGVDPIIFRKPLRTRQYDSVQLNSPDFVGSFEHDVRHFAKSVEQDFEMMFLLPGLRLLLLPRGRGRVHQLRQVHLLPRRQGLQEGPGRAQQGQAILDIVPKDKAELLSAWRLSCKQT